MPRERVIIADASLEARLCARNFIVANSVLETVKVQEKAGKFRSWKMNGPTDRRLIRSREMIEHTLREIKNVKQLIALSSERFRQWRENGTAPPEVCEAPQQATDATPNRTD